MGMWGGENESAKFWATILNGLKNRGIEDIFIARSDDLTGFDAAVYAAFPQTEIQNCIIHQLRTSSKYVSYKDLKSLGRFEGGLRRCGQAGCLDRSGRFWGALG